MRGAGFKSVEQYYAAAGSHQRVAGVKVPLLVIQAEDDPIAPLAGTPVKALHDNPNCILAGAPPPVHRLQLYFVPRSGSRRLRHCLCATSCGSCMIRFVAHPSRLGHDLCRPCRDEGRQCTQYERVHPRPREPLCFVCM